MKSKNSKDDEINTEVIDLVKKLPFFYNNSYKKLLTFFLKEFSNYIKKLYGFYFPDKCQLSIEVSTNCGRYRIYIVTRLSYVNEILNKHKIIYATFPNQERKFIDKIYRVDIDIKPYYFDYSFKDCRKFKRGDFYVLIAKIN